MTMDLLTVLDKCQDICYRDDLNDFQKWYCVKILWDRCMPDVVPDFKELMKNDNQKSYKGI